MFVKIQMEMTLYEARVMKSAMQHYADTQTQPRKKDLAEDVVSLINRQIKEQTRGKTN